jgi:hypothetical protein
MHNSIPSRFIWIFGWFVVALLLAYCPPPLVPSAMAQSHGHGGGDWHGGGGWRGGGWRGGGWRGGGWRGGIGLGWGWPYYWGAPYYGGWPYYYPPPVYETPVYQAPAPIAPQAPTWYYCDNPPGYYPNVQSCPSPWRQVPAVPPAAVPGTQR